MKKDGKLNRGRGRPPKPKLPARNLGVRGTEREAAIIQLAAEIDARTRGLAQPSRCNYCLNILLAASIKMIADAGETLPE